MIVAQPGHDLPRRPAAREGGHRRGRHGRGARRRRRPRAQVGRRRPPRRRRRRGARDPALDRADDDARCARASRRSRSSTPEEPAEDPAELYDLVPTDPRTPYDVREVIWRIVDASRFHEFKARLRRDARLRLRPHLGPPRRDPRQQRDPVLAVGAEGRALHRAVQPARASRCCSSRTSPGFMVGREYETGGIAKDGAKMVTAVSCSTVPKLTVIIGGSFGAGNYGMCGRAYDPRFLWMWPNARISVMGGEQAASVLATVRRDGIEGRGEQWPRRRGGGLQAADPRAVRAPGLAVLLDRAALGRRRDRPARHAARARPRAGRRAPAPRSNRPRYGVFRM